MDFKKLIDAIIALGCRFVPANVSSKGKAIEIAWSSDEHKESLTKLSAELSGSFIEYKGEYYNLSHQPMGGTYNTVVNGETVVKSRTRDRFALLTRSTYDDFDSALNAGS